MRGREGALVAALALAACGPLFDTTGPSAANRAPEIRSVALSPSVVSIGGTTTVTVDAVDPDGDALYYRYSATAGSVQVPDPSLPHRAVYLHDGGPGTSDIVTVTATDSRNASASARAQVRLRVNTAPSVAVRASGACHPPCTATFNADAFDAEGDTLTYSWRGCASGTGPTVTCNVTAPVRVSAVVVVDDGRGGVTTAAGEVEGVNHAPTVSGGDVVSGSPALLHVDVADPDDDALVCGWSGQCRCTGNEQNLDLACDVPPALEACEMRLRCADTFGAAGETLFRVIR